MNDVTLWYYRDCFCEDMAFEQSIGRVKQQGSWRRICEGVRKELQKFQVGMAIENKH